MANLEQVATGLPYMQLKTPHVGVNRTTCYNLFRAAREQVRLNYRKSESASPVCGSSVRKGKDGR